MEIYRKYISDTSQIWSHVIIVSSPDTKKGSGHFYPPWGNCFWNLCIDTQLSSNETHFVITWDVIAKETILCQGLKILGTCHNIDKNWHQHKWDYCSHCSWLDWSLDPPRNTSTPRSKALSRENETSIRWYLLTQEQALRNSCELLRRIKELHACKLMKLHASSLNFMKVQGTACKLM